MAIPAIYECGTNNLVCEGESLEIPLELLIDPKPVVPQDGMVFCPNETVSVTTVLSNQNTNAEILPENFTWEHLRFASNYQYFTQDGTSNIITPLQGQTSLWGILAYHSSTATTDVVFSIRITFDIK